MKWYLTSFSEILHCQHSEECSFISLSKILTTSSAFSHQLWDNLLTTVLSEHASYLENPHGFKVLSKALQNILLYIINAINIKIQGTGVCLLLCCHQNEV